MPSPKVGPPIPPPILARVPKTVIRALDVTNVLKYALAEMNFPTISPIIALNSIDSYLDAAKRQQRRIEQTKASPLKTIRSRRHTNWNMFNEIHFYLICWSRIAKLGRFIADKTRFKRAGLVLRRYHAELKDRVDCRDHLEHFEERLPGAVNQVKLLVPNDLLNMINDHVTYGGRKVDVGAESFHLLQAIVAELRTAILFDAIDILDTNNKDRLSDLLRQAVSVIQIAKITRAVQNEWNQNK